ncbi:unnamed protein product, partial [Cladocopium goreaui]
YHEGGHTLVSIGNSGADPVHKATIMPRGNALGVTWSIPEREKYSERLFELQARLRVLMGGKAAEELIFGPENVTAGCTSDLRQATGLARRMVMNFGMSAQQQSGLLSLDVDEYAVLSDQAKHEIDEKTQSLLTDAYSHAAEYLRSHEEQLHRLAQALIEFETLSAEDGDYQRHGEDHCTYCLRRKACGRANFDKREQGIFTGALYSSSKLRGLGLGLTFIQSALIHRSTGYTRHLPLVYGSLARARRLELSTGVALIEGLEAEFRLSKESWRLANSFRPRQP